MHSKVVFTFFCCTIVFLLLFGCKEKDEQPPLVSIVSPSSGTIFQVYDTVRVSFEIADETQIVSAFAQVLNANFSAVTGQVGISVLEGTVKLVLDDKLIETGDYWVLVAANDGVNIKREYLSIRIIGLPKETRAIYLSTFQGQNQSAIWKLDSLYQQVELWKTINTDILELEVNSRFDKLATVGQFSNKITCFDLPSGAINWTDNVLSNPQAPSFIDLYCSDNSFYVSLYDREFRSYSIQGALTATVRTEDYIPETIYVQGDYLLVEQRRVGDNRHFLYVYNAISRTLLRQIDFQVDIVSIVELEGSEVLVFGNEGNQAKVFQFDIADNTYWEPRQLPVGKVYQAVGTGVNKFAFTHDNGVYSYTYSPNYLNQVGLGNAYRCIDFDVDAATILVAAGNSLERYTLNGQFVNSVILQDSITSFGIHYTK